MLYIVLYIVGRISQLKSLFYYASGEQYSTHNNLTYVPAFFDSIFANITQQKRDSINTTCSGNSECIFDIIISGSNNYNIVTLFYVIISYYIIGNTNQGVATLSSHTTNKEKSLILG